MKKTLIVLMTLVFVLPLSACSVSSMLHSSGSKIDQKSISQTDIIKKNYNSWQKNVDGIEIVKSNTAVDSRGKIAESMIQLKELNNSVIQGTVYNLEKMNNTKNVAYTRATIHVDKVISGDKKLQGKDIQMALNGGITSTSQWYADKNQTREAVHDILVQYSEFPLPKIGAKLIMGMNQADENEPSPYNKALKKSKFDYKKSYVAGMPEYNLWVKNPEDKKYHLNNPQADKKLKTNPEMKQGISKLTTELNQKYNQ